MHVREMEIGVMNLARVATFSLSQSWMGAEPSADGSPGVSPTSLRRS